MTDPEARRGSAARRRRLLAFAAGTIGLLIIVGVASNAKQFETGEARTPGTREIVAIERDLAIDVEQTPTVAEPIELPDSVAVVLAVILGIAGLYLLSRQRFSFKFRRPSIQLTKSASVVTEEDEAEAIAEIARDLIDELNEGDSPRYAIQRAYAAVETGFGAKELARKQAETPLRYLDRIFGRHSSVQAPLADLTRLFQQARFSDDPVDETMRSEAIQALTEIRDYYTAFSWSKINRKLERARS